ncbi:hypothetical protein EYF80_048821 [Liparis tanakae]|uniref:Uncharacterized protein n=1 Tax=Liparis tanakae TaxID=230148 RepID=A0A4Z2FIJ3_9TELE|nr:hypothetical protein EYF80_048821 [Liparis tanakae]
MELMKAPDDKRSPKTEGFIFWATSTPGTPFHGPAFHTGDQMNAKDLVLAVESQSRANRKCEGVKVWRCGGVEVWRCGGVEVWRCGGVEVWRCGGVEVWNVAPS